MQLQVGQYVVYDGKSYRIGEIRHGYIYLDGRGSEVLQVDPVREKVYLEGDSTAYTVESYS